RPWASFGAPDLRNQLPARHFCDSDNLALRQNTVMAETFTQPGWRHGDNGRIILSGSWTLLVDERERQRLLHELAQLDVPGEYRWVLHEVDTLDSTGALLLWQVWNGQLPEQLNCNETQRSLFHWLDGMRPLGEPASHDAASW